MLSILAPNLFSAIAQTYSHIKQHGFYGHITYITRCQHTPRVYIDRYGHRVTEVDAYKLYRKHHPRYNITFTEFIRRY